MLLYEFDEPQGEDRQNLIDELAAAILQNCAPYLKLIQADIKPIWLYRGMSGPSIDRLGVGLLSPVEVRSDRRPRDTPGSLHNMLDDWLSKKFGWNLRSSGLFVSGSWSTARDFGTPCVCFPTGKFDYIWAEQIIDMTSELYHIVGMKAKSEMEQMSYEEYRSTIYSMLDKAGWHVNNGFTKYIQSYPNNEMTLNCKSYYAIPGNGIGRGIGIRDVYTSMRAMM